MKIWNLDLGAAKPNPTPPQQPKGNCEVCNRTNANFRLGGRAKTCPIDGTKRNAGK